ncbi:MAG: Gldg family protein [Eubacteriales bacterium]|nr:Gldg family protein [Eubacteriales bacterium]MDD3571676.1 Gldg family protein [Eubacteriales bacterium]MDD4133882.1 Gldg family protein [Eubacteriales bacterium]
MKKLWVNLKSHSHRGGILLSLLLFTSLAIALALAADHVESKFALRADLSFNRLTSQSDATEAVLASLPEDVHAYALFTPGNEDQALLGLLNRMAAQSTRFTYSVDSLIKNPLLASRISSDLRDQAVSADSLVIVSEATGRSRVLDITDYLRQNFDSQSQAYYISGFQYEKKIAEALVYVTTSKVPQVQILDGHGELGEGQTIALEDLLSNHNYQVSRVNLTRDGVLNPNYPLLILSPQKDLLSHELTAVRRFTGEGGAMLITSDYGDPDDLPNFDALYRSFGFERISGIVVAEEEDTATYINSPIYLVPYMAMTDITAELIASGHTTLLLPGARAFEAPDGRTNPLVTPVLTSGLAYIKDVHKAGATLLPETGDRQGTFELALLSSLAHPDGTRSQALILGNSGMLTDAWLYENTYSQEFLLHAISYLSPQNPIVLDIQPKVAARPPMVIPSMALPLLAIILVPVLLLATGVAVLFRRRRR